MKLCSPFQCTQKDLKSILKIKATQNVGWNTGDAVALKIYKLDNAKFNKHVDKEKCSLNEFWKRTASVLYRKGMMIMLTFINDKDQ